MPKSHTALSAELESPSSRRLWWQQPRLVLLVAIILPGMGQVINGLPTRGLIMLFFMLLMAVVCYQLTTPEHSVLGRYAAGWFIYAMSIMDAYQFARRRWELSRFAENALVKD